MSKASDRYLDAVVDLYKGFVNKGEIIPLEFNFPSFKVTKGIFNLYAVEALSERAKIGIDTGMYGLQKFSEELDYDELVDYSSRKKMGLTTLTEDSTTGLIIEKVLTEKIKQDTSMTSTEARNGALSSACVKTMDYKIQELINFEYFKPDTKISFKQLRNETQANELLIGTKEKIDFIATLVTMKEVLPQMHRKVLESLNERQANAQDSIDHYATTTNPQLKKNLELGIKQNKKMAALIINLKDLASSPNATILERALEVDPSLAKNFIEKYPLVMKDVLKEGAKKGQTFNI